MSLGDLAIVASISSLCLALVAIWLSIQFYRMSETNAKEAGAAAKGIATSVDRLEALFQHLYSDTFGMMRDTYSDMRRHIWPEASAGTEPVQVEIDRRSTEMINDVKAEVREEINRLTAQVGAADGQIKDLRRDLVSAVDRAIAKSSVAEVEARESTIQRSVIDSLMRIRDRGGVVTALAVVQDVESQGFRPHEILAELLRLKAQGVIYWTPDSPHGPAPRTEILYPVPPELWPGPSAKRRGTNGSKDVAA